jgi:hypothetical protein
VEIVGQERNGAVCERMAVVESSNIRDELVSALEKNFVVSGGEKIVTSDI